MTKRFLIALLAALVCFSALTGCSKNEQSLSAEDQAMLDKAIAMLAAKQQALEDKNAALAEELEAAKKAGDKVKAAALEAEKTAAAAELKTAEAEVKETTKKRNKGKPNSTTTTDKEKDKPKDVADPAASTKDAADKEKDKPKDIADPAASTKDAADKEKDTEPALAQVVNGKLEIPAGTKTIPAKAYMNKGIIVVSFADSVTTIEDRAFEGNKISSIDIPRVTKIGDRAFANNQLTEVTVYASSIGNRAFANNPLHTVTISGSANIAVQAFDCETLKYVRLDNNVKLGTAKNGETGPFPGNLHKEYAGSGYYVKLDSGEWVSK